MRDVEGAEVREIRKLLWDVSCESVAREIDDLEIGKVG